MLIETPSSMDPLIANQMWALTINLATFIAPLDVMYVPLDPLIVQQDQRTDYNALWVTASPGTFVLFTAECTGAAALYKSQLVRTNETKD